MVIPTCRRSPACKGVEAKAPEVLQRTAELIPNQLRFSAPSTLHPWGLTCRIPFGAPPFSRLQGLPALLAVDGCRRVVAFVGPPLPARGAELLAAALLV